MLKPCLIAVGDNCLDAYLTNNELTVGGNALNVAVQWRNLGAHARYFGAVGQDREAEIILSCLERAGLDVADVERLEGDTAVTLIDSKAGERRFLFESLGVGENYFPKKSHYQDLTRCDFVHLGTRPHLQLLHRLRQDGIKFSMDLSNHSFDHLNLAGIELIFASGGENPLDIAPLLEKIKQKGGQKILITCGGNGAYYHEDEQIFYAPAHNVKIVDTCGAGDGFLACFLLSKFFDGMEAQDALEAATTHAAMICTHQGGFVQTAHSIPQWLRHKYS